MVVFLRKGCVDVNVHRIILSVWSCTAMSRFWCCTQPNMYHYTSITHSILQHSLQVLQSQWPKLLNKFTFVTVISVFSPILSLLAQEASLTLQFQVLAHSFFMVYYITAVWMFPSDIPSFYKAHMVYSVYCLSSFDLFKQNAWFSHL